MVTSAEWSFPFGSPQSPFMQLGLSSSGASGQSVSVRHVIARRSLLLPLANELLPSHSHSSKTAT